MINLVDDLAALLNELLDHSVTYNTSLVDQEGEKNAKMNTVHEARWLAKHVLK